VKRVFVPVLFVFLSAFAGFEPLFAGQMQMIKLKDQSVIYGEILGMQGGIYRIKTMSVGEVKVSADQVLIIMAPEAESQLKTEPKSKLEPRFMEEKGKTLPKVSQLGKNGKKAASSNIEVQSANKSANNATPEGSRDLNRLKQDVSGKVQSMMTDPGFVEKIMKIGQNPDMQEILSDTQVMNAIQSGDYESLMNNPKMQELMENSDIKELLGDIEK